MNLKKYIKIVLKRLLATLLYLYYFDSYFLLPMALSLLYIATALCNVYELALFWLLKMSETYLFKFTVRAVKAT